MLVAFFGDAHGHLDLMYAKALAWQERTGLKLDYVFQVGDFGIWPNPGDLDRATEKHQEKDGLPPGGNFRSYAIGEKKIPIPTYFIRGNHEHQPFLRYYELIQKDLYPQDYWYRSIEIVPNLHYIPDGHIVTIKGVSPVRFSSGEIKEEPSSIRVAGWGGNFAWKTWSQNLGYWEVQGRRLNHMTRDVFERLMREDPVDVIMTHDAPTEIGLRGDPNVQLPEEEMTGKGGHPNGVPFIRQLIEEKCLRYSANGHWHEYHTAQIGRSKHFSLDKVDPGDDFDYADCYVVLEL